MKPDKLLNNLQLMSRKELEDLSEAALGDRNSSVKTKEALIKILLSENRRVRAVLDRSSSWWARHSNNVYGVIGLIGSAITLIAFLFPPSTLQPTRIDPLRKQQVFDRVQQIRSSQKHSMNAPSPERVVVEFVPMATKSGFELIEHRVVSDLRSFKQIPSVDHDKMQSPVVQTITQRVRNIGNGTTYKLKAHTSGIDVFSQSASHPLVVYASEERRTVAKYPVKPRILEFDVSNESQGQEFTIDVSKTYWNAFQNPDQSWVGIAVELPTRSIEYFVVFPDDKPYTSFEHFVNDENGNRIDLPAEEYVLEDPQKRWLWWNIVNPKPGHGYNIDWEW